MNYDTIKSNFQNFIDKPFRAFQSDAISFINKSQTPITILQAPTGSGKSLIGVCAGALEYEFTYLVANKSLQDQLAVDFPELRVLKGRVNYRCLNQTPGLHFCDECIHTKIYPCEYKSEGCEYEDQKKYVLAGKYKLLNYSYFLTEANYVGLFSQASNIIIADEADLIDHLLSDFISLKISSRIQQRFKIYAPKYKTTQSDQSIDEWKAWATYLLSKVKNRYKEIKDYSGDDPRKETKALSSVLNKLMMFVDNVDDTWIFESQPSKYSDIPTLIFKPTWITPKLSEQYFFKHADKFLMMSATFHPLSIMAKLLGRSTDDFSYYSIPNQFPVENRCVNLNPIANVTHKTFDTEAKNIVEGVKFVLERHSNEKGIIHTVNYKLAQRINDIPSLRLVFHNGLNRISQLDYFRSSNEPLVMVSPSMERGVDLPDDLCRFIIWCKAPYLNLGDKLVNRRVYSSGKIGQYWYKSQCAQTLIQGCGRGVRHQSDKCITYILDQQACDLITDHQDLFPDYFMEAVEIL